MDSEELTQGQSDTEAKKDSDFFTIVEISEIFGVSRQTIHKRMIYLQIKAHKRGNTGYLDLQQMAHLEGLDRYYKEHNRFEGYPVPEKSGPWEEEKQEETASTDTPNVKEDAESGSSTQSEVKHAITPAQSAEFEQQGVPLKTEAVVTPEEIAESEFDNIDKQAQYLAAGRYVLTQDLADYYASTGNFTIPDVVERIKQRRAQTQQNWQQAQEAYDPKYVSQLLIDRAKARAAG